MEWPTITINEDEGIKHFKKFKEFYKEELLLNESLIRTYPISSTISGLLRKWDFLKFKKQYSKFGEANTICIICESNKIDEDLISGIFKLANYYGWFISLYEAYDKNKREIFQLGKTISVEKILNSLKEFDKVKYIEINLEAKYDIELDMKFAPEFLYHITNSKYIEKIRTIGLVPKTHSKLANHPERIYLAISEEVVRNILIKQLKYAANKNKQDIDIRTGKEVEWFLITISVKDLPQVQRFFRDPNYDNGIYTLTNIRPQSIEKIEKI
jgi:hypothetical protein